MGVQGLWELLQPVGRTVDLQTMANRRYAVDASIWITQFVKAMRDEDGSKTATAVALPHAHTPSRLYRSVHRERARRMRALRC
jgi:hypothetical protein